MTRPAAQEDRDVRDVREVLHALEAEQSALEGLLRRLTGEQWETPTPAVGWSVRDQVAHLADTEEVACDTITGGPRCFRAALAAHRDAESFTSAGCRRGHGLTAGELLDWWTGAARRTRAALRAAPAHSRVAWGLGMGLRDFATARLMEHWAHGLDIRDAIGAPDEAGTTLPHIARLGHVTVPYALARAGVQRPAGRSLRFHLTGAGEPVELGPPEATDLVSGPLAAWCRVAVRRARPGDRDALTAEGPLAELALEHARAYL